MEEGTRNKHIVMQKSNIYHRDGSIFSFFKDIQKIPGMYSSVTNRRVGRNKRAGGKFLENIKGAGWNRRAGGKFSGKSINMQGGNFLANQ